MGIKYKNDKTIDNIQARVILEEDRLIAEV